jgi:hypothetical protein
MVYLQAFTIYASHIHDLRIYVCRFVIKVYIKIRKAIKYVSSSSSCICAVVESAIIIYFRRLYLLTAVIDEK